MAGLAGQLFLLAILAATVGLGTPGWLAGIGYGLLLAAALTWGLHRWGLAALGPASQVTLLRATLAGGVTALTADSFSRPAPVPVLVGLTIVALALDLVDGAVARRTGTATPLGARFDMEVDAFVLLVLSLYVAHLFGGWVVAIGAMRYAYVAAAEVLPWLRGSLPPRYWRKTVAAIQGVVLLVAAADVFPHWLLTTALAVSLAMLSVSFGTCIHYLWNHPPRTRRAARHATRHHYAGHVA